MDGTEACWNAPIERVAAENPEMNDLARARMPSDLPEPQIVQPFWFGQTLDDILRSFEALPEVAKAKVIANAHTLRDGRCWVPNPGPQTEAYFSEADELFYGGGAGGGKSARGAANGPPLIS